jgi:hypothetical protein
MLQSYHYISYLCDYKMVEYFRENYDIISS